MTITFRIAPDAAEQVGFTYSPLLEAVLSLHVLVEPKHHPLQHEWARRLRRWPVGLRREITAMSFAYRDYFPAFCFPAAEGGQQSFAEEVMRMRGLPLAAVQEEFAVALFGEAARSGARTPQPGQPSPAEPEISAALADRPEELLARFADLLITYWEVAFEEEWERLNEALAVTVRDVGNELAAHGLYQVLRRLFPEVRSSSAEGRFWLERPHAHDLALDGGERLTLVPSYYVWPHVRVNCDAPWPLSVVLPAAFLARQAEISLAPRELTEALRAVAESTRLRILRLLADRARSTEELAPLLCLSPAALSKHLRLLAAAGLVKTSRDGHYVIYELRHERLTAVGPAMETFIYGHGEPPPSSDS
jgi:DNA-binding transcriptional ArsR family regulator